MTSGILDLNTALAGRYLVTRELGAGGMATVYLADDLRHRRKVALKVLRPELAAVVGAERFLKEIETTANLQHPHILPLHDSGTLDGTAFYVMPFVDGETLRDRLVRERQLPVDDAIRITKEVASALDYAHRKGVIHRDIKPENILLAEGQALVADFGIALAASTTAGTRMTETGMSLGTPQYMSPEQAMGERTLDARTDVYALGCVLYEMLAGEPPFTGPTAQAVVAKVITSVPESLVTRRPTTPVHVDAAVRHALEKLPADRFATAAQFSEALSTTSTTWNSGARVAATPPTSRGRVLAIAAAVCAMAVMAGYAIGARRERSSGADAPVVRFTIPMSRGENVTQLAISRDGRRIAYATDSASLRRLYIRSLDEAEAHRVPDADQARGGIAFSPDGRWLAFLDAGRLRKVPSGGGAVVTIGAWAGIVHGVEWADDDMLIVGGGIRGDGLMRVSVAGGVTRPFTSAVSDSVRHLHGNPVLLPDGKSVLFTSFGPRGIEDDFLAIASLETGAIMTLPITGTAVGMAGGRMLYRRVEDGALMAVPFALMDRRITGDPVVIAETVDFSAISRSGVLLTSAGVTQSQVVWVSPSGEQKPFGTLDSTLRYRYPRLSPDGTRLAITVTGQSRNEVWLYDLASATFSTLVQGLRPEWTPDGTRIVFRSGASPSGVAWRAADGSGRSEPVALGSKVTDANIRGATVARDGQTLMYENYGDLFTAPIVGTGAARPVLVSPRASLAARFSPDGKWIVYECSDSGRYEVCVRPLNGADANYQVSAGAATEPLWSSDSTRIFYRDRRKVIAATVAFTPAFHVVSRATLFEGDFQSDEEWAQYDVARDGRFVMLRPAGARATISVVVNWPADLAAAH